ncbi:hypothetical protein BJI49_11730 [Acetobacter pasteurianus]|nr:DNA translocase FtsK [Acetobacter pasteurianus]RCL05006.1 hypothetical protein BJI49_11730 [Acetobacter pasteurianus]GAB30077.1 hypothetical protein APS_0679 [Acetobacter pasteurianus subsp. pasteurianus LMG 1262 = NBRC 106471]GCD48897.1 hypothetical protein NBRC106471_0453 [Acetobacter pasteurianus subsp. pasteurianus LMG 1262 = NBRC 106471]
MPYYKKPSDNKDYENFIQNRIKGGENKAFHTFLHKNIISMERKSKTTSELCQHLKDILSKFLMGQMAIPKTGFFELCAISNSNSRKIVAAKNNYINFMVELYISMKARGVPIAIIADVLYCTSTSQYIFLEDILTDEGIYERALKLTMQHQKPSASFLQRELDISYDQALAYLNRMETSGLVSPPNEIGARTILKKLKF